MNIVNKLNLSNNFINIRKITNKFITIEKDDLSFMQIIPHHNVSNGRKIDNIVDSLYPMGKLLLDRISFDKKNKKIIYKTEDKFTYGVLIEHDKISFYLAVPSQWQNWVSERIYTTHSNSATVMLNQEDYLNSFDINYTNEWEINPTHKNFKSFCADYRENSLIPSIIGCQKDLKMGDKVLLELNSKPVDSLWKENSLKLQSKYRKGGYTGLNNSFTIFSILDYIIKFFDGLLNTLDFIFAVDKEEDREGKFLENRLNRAENTLTNHSLDKIRYNGFTTKCRILTQCTNPVRNSMISESMLIAMKNLSEDGDNDFEVIKKSKNKIHRPKIIFNFNSHIFSTKELGQIMQLPERKWQNEYKMEKKDTQEIDMPSQLFEDGIPIGEVSYKGTKKIASWNDKNKDVACLPRVMFGFQGYGKTECQIRYAIEALKRKHSVFIIDGIKRCEMSTKVLNYLPENFPDEKIIILKPCSLEKIIPLAWNETNVNSFKDQTSKYKFANSLTQQLILLLDSMVEDKNQRLSPRMKRYLTSASMLVFSMEDASIIDVLNVLDDYDVRHKFMEKSNLSQNNKIIQDLLKLDNVKTNKEGNVVEIGTKDNDIKFIIDRLDLLLNDFILRQLFLAKPNPDINFTKWADEGYLVIFQMPEDDDINISTIDTITTFLISKLWLAMQKRKTERQVDVLIDEIHRLPTAKKQLDNIREHRKRRLSYFFTAHQPQDFGSMLNTLKSSGASFMLLGTTKENLKYFEREIQPFTIEECLETKKFHAKCIINYDREFITFDAKLPDLIEKTEKYNNREYLIEECAKKYGVKMKEFY